VRQLYSDLTAGVTAGLVMDLPISQSFSELSLTTPLVAAESGRRCVRLLLAESALA
jgi:hypothetical protein